MPDSDVGGIFANIPPALDDVDKEAGQTENAPEAGFLADPVVAAAIKKIDRSRTGIENWRVQAAEARKFEAGYQYGEVDLRLLAETQRPSAVFNVAQKFIRLISGIERRIREHVEFIPLDVTNPQTAIASEFVSKVYQWVLRQCDGEEERSRAFVDKLVDGMGWMETRLDTTTDPAGRLVLERIDGMEMLWDVTSRKENLRGDMGWIGRVRLIPYEEALVRWPDKKEILYSMRNRGADSPETTQVQLFNWVVAMSQFGGPQPNTDTLGLPYAKHMVPIVDFQWREYESGYFFYDPLEKTDAWLNEKDFKLYQQRLPRIGVAPIEDYIRQLKPTYKRFLFTGRNRLTDPITLQDQRFTYNAMTGSWDDDKKLWYGFMRLLMDPQRYANKFANLALEIMAVQGKAGIMAEIDAFQNNVVAEQTWSTPGSIQWMNKGGLEKVKPKDTGQFPQGTLEFFRECIQMMDVIAGVNAESLGTASGDVPVGTAKQRELANVAILAQEFSSLRLYRKEEARTVIGFLSLIADDRLIRLGDQYDQRIVPLIRDPFLLQYEVMLEENDNDPNTKRRYWEQLLPIIPMLIRTNNFIPEILDYAPYPRRIVEGIKQGMARQAQQQMEMQKQGLTPGARKNPENPEERQARIQKLTADASLAQAKTKMLERESQLKNAKTMLDAIVAQERMRSERAKRLAMAVDVAQKVKGGNTR